MSLGKSGAREEPDFNLGKNRGFSGFFVSQVWKKFSRRPAARPGRDEGSGRPLSMKQFARA